MTAWDVDVARTVYSIGSDSEVCESDARAIVKRSEESRGHRSNIRERELRV